MWSAFLVGLLAYTMEIGLIITPAVFGLAVAGAPGGYPDIGFAVGWSLAIGWPLLLEMIAMTAALALNPERLGLTRRRKALVNAGRYALTLDFLVRSPDWRRGVELRPANVEVEAFCADTGYLRTRFDAGALAAAELLRRVGHGDIAEMGLLLAQAVPPVAPADLLGPGPELIGRVVSSRWPVGGPPEELLGPAGHRPEAGPAAAQPRTCQRCGKPLKTDGSGGRPAKYCSGACRTAAHRARRRTAPATAAR